MRTRGDIKDYGRDATKRLVRRKFLEFIDGTFGHSSYGGLKVLCLPGQELWEVNEVYSNLPGVREKNLTLVERNPLNARLIQASIPEAEIFSGEMLDYVKKTDKRFDVISLDFCSEMTEEVSDILMEIRHRELLADRACLLLAVTGNREKEGSKEIYRDMVRMAALHTTPQDSVRTAMMKHSVGDELIDRNLAKVRSDAVSHRLTCTLLGGSEQVYLEWMVGQRNSALLRRIEERMMRHFMANKVLSGGSYFRDKYGIPVEPKQGEHVEALGICIPLPGRLTSAEIESSAEAIRTAPLVIGDDTKIEDGKFQLAQETWDKFRANMLAILGLVPATVEGSPEDIKQFRFLAVQLFKQSLLELFQEDLGSWTYKAKGCKLEIPAIAGGLAFEYTMGARAGVYWTTGLDRYRYISDSNTPMLVDMVRTDRTFQYTEVVEVDPQGRIVPKLSPKHLRDGDIRRVARELHDRWAGLQEFANRLMKSFPLIGDSSYPERTNLKEDAMHSCTECQRLEKELDLLKAQLVEMRKVITERRGVRRQVVRIGVYERRKIAEMLQANTSDEGIVAELKVKVRQVAAVKAWITMRGGYDAYFQWLDGVA